jgi:hypothetical protein
MKTLPHGLAKNHRQTSWKSAGVLALVISGTLATSALALPQFNIVKPSTTGVPGEEVRVMKFDPASNLWIAGRFYFWGETGLVLAVKALQR